jgi:hypothetical protein
MDGDVKKINMLEEIRYRTFPFNPHRVGIEAMGGDTCVVVSGLCKIQRRALERGEP